MNLQVPVKYHQFFYFGIDTRARAGIGDELIGFGFLRFYVGVYPTRTGFDISVGITDDNGCL